jgi:hypothetical protein
MVSLLPSDAVNCSQPLAVLVFCLLLFAAAAQVSWIKAHINTANVSSFCILLLVWLTFCNTFGNKTVGSVPGRDVAGTVFLDVALFILFVLVCFAVAWPPPPLQGLRHLMRMTKPDVVAVVICGSTKTVAMGVPLISVMYKQVPYAGLLALPLIVYHALQVLLGGLMLGPLKMWCLAGSPAADPKAPSRVPASDGDSGDIDLEAEQQASADRNGSQASGSEVNPSRKHSSSSRWQLLLSGLRAGKAASSSGSAANVV